MPDELGTLVGETCILFKCLDANCYLPSNAVKRESMCLFMELCFFVFLKQTVNYRKVASYSRVFYNELL